MRKFNFFTFTCLILSFAFSSATAQADKKEAAKKIIHEMASQCRDMAPEVQEALLKVVNAEVVQKLDQGSEMKVVLVKAVSQFSLMSIDRRYKEYIDQMIDSLNKAIKEIGNHPCPIIKGWSKEELDQFFADLEVFNKDLRDIALVMADEVMEVAQEVNRKLGGALGMAIEQFAQELQKMRSKL